MSEELFSKGREKPALETVEGAMNHEYTTDESTAVNLRSSMRGGDSRALFDTWSTDMSAPKIGAGCLSVVADE
jgi:hypothetical protein